MWQMDRWTVAYHFGPLVTTECPISISTPRIIRKPAVISMVNRIRRASWFRQKLTWNVKDHWKWVIFTDKTQPDEIWQAACLGGGRSRKISVMFWGCISYFGAGTLTGAKTLRNILIFWTRICDRLCAGRQRPGAPFFANMSVGK